MTSSYVVEGDEQDMYAYQGSREDCMSVIWPAPKAFHEFDSDTSIQDAITATDATKGVPSVELTNGDSERFRLLETTKKTEFAKLGEGATSVCIKFMPPRVVSGLEFRVVGRNLVAKLDVRLVGFDVGSPHRDEHVMSTTHEVSRTRKATFHMKGSQYARRDARVRCVLQNTGCNDQSNVQRPISHLVVLVSTKVHGMKLASISVELTTQTRVCASVLGGVFRVMQISTIAGRGAMICEPVDVPRDQVSRTTLAI